MSFTASFNVLDFGILWIQRPGSTKDITSWLFGRDIHCKIKAKSTEFHTLKSGELMTSTRATIMTLRLTFGRKLLDGVQPAGIAVYNC